LFGSGYPHAAGCGQHLRLMPHRHAICCVDDWQHRDSSPADAVALFAPSIVVCFTTAPKRSKD
jgi:hypothetical protein